MRIYLSAPMRGFHLYNFPLFDDAADVVRSFGHEVVSPADIDRSAGLNPASFPGDHDWNSLPPGMNIKEIARRDLEAIMGCDAILMLPGWEDSVGAVAELRVAEWVGLLVFKWCSPWDVGLLSVNIKKQENKSE